MKKINLNYSPFRRYHGTGLIFVRPLGSKLFRLFLRGSAKWTPGLLNFLTKHSFKKTGCTLAEGNRVMGYIVFVFKMKGEEMEGLCMKLSSHGYAAATLETNTETLN